jgi:hypothetical protein
VRNLPYDPYDVVCEILGQPAKQMQNPVNAEYECPYVNSTCTKRSQRSSGPFPCCSVFRKEKNGSLTPVVVCPKRLYQADIFHDVIKNCWPGDPPTNPIFVHEVKMGGVGNVDMVVADLTADREKVRDFISVELQAIDITGSYEPAYSAIVLNKALEKKPTYNFNYRNVQKRFVTQLVDKGFYHHHWGTKIIAVVQDIIFDKLKDKIKFDEVAVKDSNVVFLQYKMEPIERDGDIVYELKFKGIVGTTHSSLMMSSLYQPTPPKAEFCERIIKIYKSL